MAVNNYVCVCLCIHTCLHTPGPKREQWTTGKGFQYSLKGYQIIGSAITDTTKARKLQFEYVQNVKPK